MKRVIIENSDSPLRTFIDCFGSQIEHGLIVFGSYYRNTENILQPASKSIRDIDIVALKDGDFSKHGVVEIDGIRFDVHEYGISVFHNLIEVKRDLIWIRNMFESALILEKTQIAGKVFEFINRLKLVHPADYLPHRNKQDDVLKMKSFLHKLKTHRPDCVTSSYYLYNFIYSLYYWKCLDIARWPEAYPPLIRQDIRIRFPEIEDRLLLFEKMYGIDPSAHEHLDPLLEYMLP